MHKILSLFDYSGEWSKPYREAGYNVIQLDIKNGDDVRLYQYYGQVYGILAAPPCTDFASSGARWWKEKGNDPLINSLALVDATMRIVLTTKPKFWVIENPVGRLKNWIGPTKMTFNPCDFAGWSPEGEVEKNRYTKRTCLWGDFNNPVKKPIEPIRVCKQGSWVQKLGGKSEKTKELRSTTPSGFARAFFEANK